MIAALLRWLDDRTGIRDLLHAALYEHIPGGARYRYVWGSTLVFAFVVQAMTGIVLWMGYSPSGHTAWESVYYIQYEMVGGWLVRGLHHFMAQAMVVLLAVHFAQVVIDGAYRAPREVNFWLGLLLLKVVLGLALTGYLLPWDQKGYWATRVATNLMGMVPLVGTDLQKLVVGGTEYGHHTLTRFFAMHAGVLPALLVVLLAAHVALFRRHGLHVRQPLRRPDTTFWPDQVLKDAVACLGVLAVVLLCVVWGQVQGVASGEGLRPWNGDYLGAELGPPADPAHEYSAARPEWYFLFLFQFLKLFEAWGETGELVGAIVVPAAVMALLFLMPILGRWRLGHRFNLGLLGVLLAGVAILTSAAWWDDHRAAYTAEPPPSDAAAANHSGETAREAWLASRNYLQAVEEAESLGKRARELAQGQGIPPEGVLSLLRKDAKVAGPRLFKQYCAACHDHSTVDANGRVVGIQAERPAAPNLYGFATRDWLAGLLDPKRVGGPHYFGNTKLADNSGGMVEYVTTELEARLKPAERALVVAALAAEAGLPSRQERRPPREGEVLQGRRLITGKGGCTDCHRFYEEGSLGSAPDLTGYGSREWLMGMISDPNHERYYGHAGDEQQMPAFAPHPAGDARNQLTPQQLALLVDWLRGEWYERQP